MTKEIERVGIPTVQICTIIPISETIGVSRIQKALAIPHPLGNPKLDKDAEYEVRKQIVHEALDLLMKQI